MTLSDLDTMTLDELLEVCNSDPAHVAYAEPEDWLCGRGNTIVLDDYQDLKRTEHDASF